MPEYGLPRRDDGAKDGERLMRDELRAHSESTGSIDFRVAELSGSDVFDAASVVDGIAAESSLVIPARGAVTQSNEMQMFDVGIDPSATTDSLHDDSPMLPERPDPNDHHS